MRNEVKLANPNYDSSKIEEFKNVWVFCEQRQGQMMSTSYELISEGRKLADELGVKLCGLLVGDNVGDVAGMGSDLFESYVGSIVSAITLAIAIPTIQSGFLGEVALDPVDGSLFPLFLAAIGIIASVIAVFFVNGKTANPAKQLNLGTYISSAIVIVAAYFLSDVFFKNMGAFIAVVIGLVVGVAIGKITEYYTSGDYKPVKEIANQCETGAATCIISGFATGLTSTVFPLLLIAVGILGAYYFFGLYGIAIAAVGMLIKAFWITCPKWFSSIIYIAMGWVCVLVFGPLLNTLSTPAFLWLLFRCFSGREGAWLESGERHQGNV